MSKKNCDEHGRLRSKTCAFRVSPEEYRQIEEAVSISGMNKQDYLLSKALDRQIIVQGNCKVHRAVCDRVDEVLNALKKLECGSEYNEYLSADVNALEALINQLYLSL